MSGNTNDKISVCNNAGKKTPAATAPMANAYANATVLEKIENLPATFRHKKCNETSSRFLFLNIKGNDKSYQNPTGSTITYTTTFVLGALKTPNINPPYMEDLCISKSPRLHPSTSRKKRKFPVKESRIRQSTRMEDSRQSDGSFSDIQETLRVAHPRGSREQPEEVTKRHRQKEIIYRSPCDRALVQRSLQVLKDKSTGPPREEDSTPQQRSPFLQGPVTGLRTLYPADECQSSLKHQQVHLRRTLHHWDKPTWVTRQESKSCRQLKYKIKLPNTTRSPSNRPKKKSEKGKQRPVHYKNAEMELMIKFGCNN
ncbi:hypothetical protein F2Q69_00047855 [Brassica cretica]|uniref:Uncharacterized protein n=1 Tax=Brassica cretica TaxID=69181 RepID=A0A8S9Q1K0_BRACR|nr:hypothetical protein F2Q69_00047855 [Brassica cretica]